MDSIVLWDKIRFVTSLSNEVWLHCQLPIGIQGPAELGGFKSAENFICQKVQKFWARSGYVGKINNKKNKKCLALPKDRQSFCEVQRKCHQIFYYI